MWQAERGSDGEGFAFRRPDAPALCIAGARGGSAKRKEQATMPDFENVKVGDKIVTWLGENYEPEQVAEVFHVTAQRFKMRWSLDSGHMRESVNHKYNGKALGYRGTDAICYATPEGLAAERERREALAAKWKENERLEHYAQTVRDKTGVWLRFNSYSFEISGLDEAEAAAVVEFVKQRRDAAKGE